VDNNGNPAFTASNDSIWWKRDGKTWSNIRSCAGGIAFGPKNTLYKLLCKRVNKGSKVLKWNARTKTWKRLSNTSAQRLTIDSTGRPWIVAGREVLRWDTPGWVNMGLQDVKEIKAGPDGSVYALAFPKKGEDFDSDLTIYKWNGG
jgi:hypothetical protein